MSETLRGPALAALVAEIKEMQRRRKLAITAQSRADRAIESHIATVLFQYHSGKTEKERKAEFKEAGEIRRAVERGKPAKGDVALHRMIVISGRSRALWDDERALAEGEMRKAAARLPVASWAETVPGFGLLNLAILVGETGLPLERFATVSRLWKRLMVAVIRGQRQQKIAGNKPLAVEHGYRPPRHAEVFVVGSVSVFLAQRPGMPYREVYDRRRMHTAPRVAATAHLPKGHLDKWGKLRCDMDARRVMTKALIRDLWIEWQSRV